MTRRSGATVLAATALAAASAGAGSAQRDPDCLVPDAGRGASCAEPSPGDDFPVAEPRALRAAGPLTVVYDFAPIASHLYAGSAGVRGLSSTVRSARQYPLGDPFPPERWLGKVHRSEIAGRSPARIAALLRAGMSRHRLGDIASGFVAVDEVGIDFTDARSGPALLAAMRILARARHPETTEPLNRRVLMYAAPVMVANVGAGNDRADWDAALAAGRLSGGLYLQMYHAESGVVTGPFTAQEWRDYLPVWRREMGRDFPRLRVILSHGRGVAQDEQWRRARQTPAGRAVLRHGVGAYNLRTRAEATGWLRNWNRHGPGAR